MPLDLPDLAPEPVTQFGRWYADWCAASPPEATAMTLSTVDGEGQPWTRTVLLKQFDARGFVFFTNRDSHKGRQLAANPRAALHFLWLQTQRQVLVQGEVVATGSDEDDAYFASRPRESQLGAWASEQSRPLPDRRTLETRFDSYAQQHAGATVPRPPHWGGFRLVPTRVEFWQAGAHRLHDRFAYTRDDDGWRIDRLNP